MSKVQNIIFFLLLLFFNSCKESNHTKIGVCITETTRPIYTRMKEAMLENQEKLGIKVLWFGVKDKQRRVDYAPYQEEIIYQLLQEGIEALIFNPIKDQTVYSLVYHVQDKGIPVIALDKLLEDLRFDAYVTTNEKEMGRQAASYFVEKIEGKGNVIVLEGIIGDKKKRDIVLGFYKVLDQYPKIRIVSSPHLSEENSAFNHVNLMLSRYAGNIQGVIACDSPLIVGAVRAIDAHGLAEMIVTVGVGASKEACLLLRPHRPNMSKHDMELYSAHYERGLMALETAVKLINGKNIQYDTMLQNGEVKVKTLYGTIRKLTYRDYYSEVRNLWPELFVEEK